MVSASDSTALMAVPAAIRAICASGNVHAWRQLTAVLGVLVTVTLADGFWQLRSTESVPSVTIGLIDVRQTEDSLPWKSVEGRKVLESSPNLAIGSPGPLPAPG